MNITDTKKAAGAEFGDRTPTARFKAVFNGPSITSDKDRR